LLKDGIRVKESAHNPLYNDESPYYSTRFSDSDLQKLVNKNIQQTMETINQLTEAYQKELNISSEDITKTPSQNIYISRPNNLYDYRDIDLNSKYEIVVIYEDGETRIPVDFSKFK